jgi:hypothetical protein
MFVACVVQQRQGNNPGSEVQRQNKRKTSEQNPAEGMDVRLLLVV